MSLYNMLFGRNSQTDLLLAVIGLRQCDVERLRDVFASSDGASIDVYTRTGGGNREGYPNLAMRKRPEWTGSVDDEYDSTYCTDSFVVPTEWHGDVAALSDVLGNGLRKEFAQHLSATLRREPTDADKAAKAYEAEERELARARFIRANGHTFVPLDDTAMKTALRLAEANEGELRTCWGIMPLKIEVRQNLLPYPGARDEDSRLHMVRAEIVQGAWEIDEAYWKHCQRFAPQFPKAMAKIAQAVLQARLAA